MKQTVVFDFDGVIHSYTSGWNGMSCIPDPPVPGIKEAIDNIRAAGYEVVVVSTRCSTEEGAKAIGEYLSKHDICVDDVQKEKPPAIVYIDDRAICFDGHPEKLLGRIKAFKPWNVSQETNADRIRSMTDEELAEHLVDIGWDCHLCAEHRRLDNESLLRGEKCDGKCTEHCLEWLQQPQKGE